MNLPEERKALPDDHPLKNEPEPRIEELMLIKLAMPLISDMGISSGMLKEFIDQAGETMAEKLIILEKLNIMRQTIEKMAAEKMR
jgi:hypothetical protein